MPLDFFLFTATRVGRAGTGLAILERCFVPSLATLGFITFGFLAFKYSPKVL